jgi:FtsP/CotA-like multicopper oxidase with cupredoxin domain
MYDTTRRRLLGALAGLPLAAAFAAARAAPHGGHGLRRLLRDPPGAAKFERPLRLPSPAGLFAEHALDAPLELTARVGAFPIFGGGATDVWHYAATLGGRALANPLLRVRRGAPLDVTLANRLGDDTTIHWHGLMVDAANDGGGMHPVGNGASRRYRFDVHNRGGLYWYHAHPHFRTGEQVHMGLAGPLLVDDDETDALSAALGLDYGVTDLPLVVADKQTGRGNALKYAIGEDDWIGNRTLVNWTPEPYLDVTPQTYRFRIANVANARVYRLAFVRRGAPLPYTLLGTDGGLLERPQLVRELYLAPAQRVDLLLDLSVCEPGERVLVTSLPYDPMENEGLVEPYDPMLEHPGAAPMGEALDLMELRVGAGPRRRVRAPARLARAASVAPSGAARRKLRLHLDDRGRWLINEWNFALTGHAPAFAVQRGAREVWEITNAMRSMPHPVHLHAFQFSVLERRDSPRQVRRLAVAAGGRTAHDLGLLDTVLVWPGETVRIALDFAQPFRGEQHYMFHCHNLEHEDQGMMIHFAVVD